MELDDVGDIVLKDKRKFNEKLRLGEVQLTNVSPKPLESTPMARTVLCMRCLLA